MGQIACVAALPSRAKNPLYPARSGSLRHCLGRLTEVGESAVQRWERAITKRRERHQNRQPGQDRAKLSKLRQVAPWLCRLTNPDGYEHANP